MTKKCAHEIGPWSAGQQWPVCLKCEIERLRTRCEAAYGIWSRNQGPESEAADRMADILNEILQGLSRTHEPYCTCPPDYPHHAGHHEDCNSQRTDHEPEKQA